jgi:isohexenylglutaconyl-CoA hydratase
MRDEQPLIVRREGPVVRAVLNRPHRRNAMSAAMMAAMDALLDELEADRGAARVLVLEGAGGHFCAGLDLGEVAADAPGEDGAAKLAAQAARNAATGARFARIAALPQAVVARVQGGAFAGGLGFVCAADVALCDDTARFSAPEVRRGLVAAQILPWVVRRTGRAAAQRMVLQANVLDAAAAARAGLVHEALPDAAALDAAVAAAVADLLRGAPGAVAETKGLLAALGPAAPEGYAAAGAAAFARCAAGEAKEGIAAFREKRPPAWETARP